MTTHLECRHQLTCQKDKKAASSDLLKVEITQVQSQICRPFHYSFQFLVISQCVLSHSRIGVEGLIAGRGSVDGRETVTLNRANRRLHVR